MNQTGTDDESESDEGSGIQQGSVKTHCFFVAGKHQTAWETGRQKPGERRQNLWSGTEGWGNFQDSGRSVAMASKVSNMKAVRSLAKGKEQPGIEDEPMQSVGRSGLNTGGRAGGDEGQVCWLIEWRE